VRDTGPGVAPELRTQIFERFARGDHDDEGFGLGLSIVAAIAAAHGGRVEVTHTPGGGATFTVTLPLTAATAPTTAEAGGAAWPAS
jgi:signal transduction histidine kinase